MKTAAAWLRVGSVVVLSGLMTLALGTGIASASRKAVHKTPVRAFRDTSLDTTNESVFVGSIFQDAANLVFSPALTTGGPSSASTGNFGSKVQVQTNDHLDRPTVASLAWSVNANLCNGLTAGSIDNGTATIEITFQSSKASLSPSVSTATFNGYSVRSIGAYITLLFGAKGTTASVTGAFQGQESGGPNSQMFVALSTSLLRSDCSSTSGLTQLPVYKVGISLGAPIAF